MVKEDRVDQFIRTWNKNKFDLITSDLQKRNAIRRWFATIGEPMRDRLIELGHDMKELW
jgi:hypothetical protein